MALVSKILKDDSEETVVHVTTDVTSSSVIIVNVSELVDAPSTVRIAQIWYSAQSKVTDTSTAGWELEWDASANIIAWVIPPNDSGFLNFEDHEYGGYMNTGGLKNTASSPTGDINLTSANFTAGDSISLVLRLLKQGL